MTTEEKTEDTEKTEGNEDEGRRSARAAAPKVVDPEETGGEEGDEQTSSSDKKKVIRHGDGASSRGDEPDESEETLEEESSEVEEEQEDAETLEEETSEVEEEKEEDEEEEEDEVPEDLIAAGSEWLDGLFERMKLDVNVDEATDGERVYFNLGGPDADRLLGLGNLAPKAIEGVETVMGSVFSKHPDSSNIYVDVDEARERRKEQLQRIANDLADKAVALGKTVTVSGFNSTERRVIHRELRNYGGVETESVGNGVFRRLQIEPK